MVNQQLLETYERLNKKRKLYKQATSQGEFIRALGVSIYILSIILIIPKILEWLFDINLLVSMIGGIFLGIFIISIGKNINKGTIFSIEDEMFLIVFEALEYIETYQKEKFDVSRKAAVKKLSKFRKLLREPLSYPILRTLTKDVYENVRIFNRNFKEKLIPSIIPDNDEDVTKVYSILEKLAQYFLNPTISELKDINKSMAELNPDIKEKASIVPFLSHPYIQHMCIFITFVLIGIFIYYFGTTVLTISKDNAFIAGTTLIGTLSGGYIVVITTRK